MKTRRIRRHQTSASPDVPDQSLDASTNGRWHVIAEKAYELYEQRGRVDGHDVEDWLKAEAIIGGATD